MDQNALSVIADLAKLKRDMSLFAEVYAQDAGSWKGDAAYEESCYISADIDDFNDLTEKIEEELRQD